MDTTEQTILKLHDALAREIVAAQMRSPLNSAALEEISRINTELVTLQKGLASATEMVRRNAENLEFSEARYRRLFESAKDGILILDATTGNIEDVNPFLCQLLGYAPNDFLGKQLWEIGTFRDIAANQDAFRTLQQQEYVRYDDLPLETKDGRSVSVEFVSNVYFSGDKQVIQCNIRDITERKHAGLAERESQRFLQSTLDALSAHIAVLDGDGEIIAVNKAWQQYAVQNEGNADLCGIGANYLEVCDEASGAGVEDAPSVAQGIRAVVVDQKQSFELEYPCHSPQEDCWFNLRVSRFVGEGPVRVVVSHENVTERKKAENLTRASEERLATTQEIAHLGSWELELSNLDDINRNVFLRWSDEVFHIFGRQPSEAEISYQDFLDSVHPDDRDRAANVLIKAIHEGTPYRIEHRIVLPDGEERHVHRESVVMFDASGEPLKMVGTIQDISDRKEAEKALHDSEERYRSLAEAMPQIVWTAQPDGALDYYNQRWFDYTGMTFEQTRGWGWAPVIHPDDLQQCYDLWNAAVYTGEDYQVEYRFKRASDGTYRWHLGRAVPLRDEKGQIVKWFGTCTDIHDRRQVEEERDRFFTLSLDMLAIIGSDGYLKRLNPAFEATLGFTNAELMAVPFLNFVYLDDHAPTLGAMATLDNGAQIKKFENRCRCLDGSYKWLRWTAAPFEKLWYCVAHDVTEAKQTEWTIRESAEYFRFLNDLSEATRPLADAKQVMAVTARMLGEHLGVSRCAYADVDGDGEQFTILHDYTNGCASTVGKYQLSLFGPRAVATLTSGQTLVIRNVGAELLPNEGAEMFNAIGIQAIITCPLVKDGVLRGMMAVHQTSPRNWQPSDITLMEDVVERCWATIERRTAEERIHQLNTELELRVAERTIELESSNRKLRDNEVRLLEGNTTFTELTRLRASKMEELETALQQVTEASSQVLDAERCSVWLYNEDRSAIRCLDLYETATREHSQGFELASQDFPAYFQALKSGRTIVADDAHTHPATHEFSVPYLKPFGIISMLDTAIIVGGEMTAVLCCERTGKARSWQAADQTFGSSAAATCALALESYERARAETELRQARDEADNANLAKSEFLSRMSHELRTPLNAIIGFGQILERQDLTLRTRESVGYILKGGRHLLVLINEILDIARVEAGHLEVSLEPVALHDVVPDACALVQPLAAERGIRLDIRGASETVELCRYYILADLQRLKQVLINLLSNAIKYNRDEGQVVISCQQKRDGWISIAVRDTGPGISPQDIPKLFMPFERLGAATSSIEGTGLGLVLSQRLVTAMGGTLTLESTLGQGSTFTIELPQTDPPEELLTNVPEGAPPLEMSRELGRTFSVLCIEDNPSNLRLMESIFEDRPEITLMAAMQGSVGLDLARRQEPDLILLDLDLPDIHGSEVLTRLQRSAITRDIPVVVVSADATPNQIERLLSGGAKSYLTKPLDVGQFLHTVDKFLQTLPESAAQPGKNEDA